MSQANLFNSIRKQIVDNEIYGNEKILQFRNYYPENIIVWLTTKQKCFKVTSVKKYWYKSDKIFELEYKDVNTACDFLSVAYDIAKSRIDRAIKKGYMTINVYTDNTNCTHIEYVENTEPVGDKFRHIADKYRDELECPNWSNKKDETGYSACPYNNREFEYLSREDSQSFEHFVQSLGYDNYQDFLKYNEFAIDEDRINQLYQKFLEGYESPEYAF